MIKKRLLLLLYTSSSFALPIPAIISSVNQAKMASPMSGIIKKINFKAGQVFKKNDLLLEFKCEKQLSELKKEKAILDRKSRVYQGYQRLRKLGAISQIELAEAKSEQLEAQALWEVAFQKTKDCKLIAPFRGQVTERYVNAYEYIEIGKPLIDIINFNELEIKIIAPSSWLKWMKKGINFTVKLQETNQTYKAKVVRYNLYTDPVSQTFAIFAKFIKEPINITPGMSGNAIFSEDK